MEFYNFKIIQNFKGLTPNFAHVILPLEKLKYEVQNIEFICKK